MAGRPLATLRRPKLTPVFLNLDACSHAVRSLASVARLSGPVRDAVAARPSVRPSVRLSVSLEVSLPRWPSRPARCLRDCRRLWRLR